MIVNKQLENLRGMVEFEIKFKNDHFFGVADEEDEIIYECETFSNINELLSILAKENLKELYDYYENEYMEIEEMRILGIRFSSSSADKETSTSIVVATKLNGWVSAKFNNEDIDNRLLLNIKKIKEIIDNTVEQYPINYN